MNFLFKGDADDEEAIARAKAAEAEAASIERERVAASKRLKALLDSDTWKDISLIIRGLKETASAEARAFNSPQFLYGIDFLTKLEKEIVAKSNLY